MENWENENIETFYCGKCHHHHFFPPLLITHRQYEINQKNDTRNQYKCDLCNKTYMNKSSLRRHTNKHHHDINNESIIDTDYTISNESIIDTDYTINNDHITNDYTNFIIKETSV